MGKLISRVAVVGILAVLTLWGLGGITNVQLGETGIKIVMVGADKGATSPIYTGLQWIEPFSNDVAVYYTKFQQYEVPPIEAQTKDGQPVQVTVSFQVGLIPNQVPWLHENVGYGWYDEVFLPAAVKAIKDSTALERSDDIYTGEGRVKIANAIQTQLTNKFEGYGIRFETNLRDTEFENQAFVNVLEEKAKAAQQEEIQHRYALAAKQEAIAIQNKAEGEKFKVEQAAQAERIRLREVGAGEREKQEEIAKGILAVGNAEAEVIKMKANALMGSGGTLYRDIEVLGGLGKSVEFYGVPTGAPGTSTYIIDEALNGKVAIGGN